MNDNGVLPYSRQAVRINRYLSRQFAVIAGPGCGKSSLCDRLVKAFIPHLEYRYAGQLMHERATMLGMKIEEFTAHTEAHPEEGHDQWCDDQVTKFGLMNNVVIDCHLPCFVPYGFMIFLTCGLRTRIERRAKSKGWTLARAQADIESREKNDLARYPRIYPGSIWLETDYDLVINTETHDEDQTFKIAMYEHSNWLDRNRHNLIRDAFMPQGQLAVC